MWRSKEIISGHGSAVRRSLYKSMGYTEECLNKPLIGIANSWSTVCPGSFNLKSISNHVKSGIYKAGGTPVEFGTIGACDGISAHNKGGMRYVLPTRDIIANSIEMMIQAHWLDGVVLLGSCDKIVPGMLMAAARLNLPAILVNGGPMMPGVLNGEKVNTSDLQEAEGSLESKKTGNLSVKKLKNLEEAACPGPGSCSQMATANTMSCFSEALGLSLPGSSTIPAIYSNRLVAGFKSGEQIVEMIKKGINSKDIINEDSMINALKVSLSLGGSTNTILHWLAIAHEANLDLSINDINKISKKTPQITSLLPSGKYYVVDFHEAGGLPAVIKELFPILNTETLTVTGDSLFDNNKKAIIKNHNVIKNLTSPIREEGGLVILKGNLAEKGSVAKPSGIPKNMMIFEGRAKIFNSENNAIDALLDNEIKEGDVVVIRYEGPSGGPGMQEMWKFMKMMEGTGLGNSVAVITDGRFSGGNIGCFVCHICPEAARKGVLAILEDGDKITIDIPSRKLEAKLSNVEITSRFKNWQKLKPKVESGYLDLYSKIVGPASNGATLIGK